MRVSRSSVATTVSSCSESNWSKKQSGSRTWIPCGANASSGKSFRLKVTGVSARVTFFVAASSVEDVGVLAGRPRHDYCPQSLMIQGVMSPGPDGGADIAERGLAEVREAVRNVDTEPFHRNSQTSTESRCS